MESRRGAVTVASRWQWRSFHHAASVRFDIVLFPLPAHRTGQADFPHPALGKDAHRKTNLRHVTPSATSEPNPGVARRIVNPHVLCCFLRWSLTEAPSLHRHYSASSVLRASPSPHTARPDSRELLVDPNCDPRWGFPCCLWSPLPACHRHYPGRSDGTSSLDDFHQRRPSPITRWVGSCINRFEACTAFTLVMACTLAESPSDPLHRKLRPLRCLCRRFGCYRVERTSSRAGIAPAEVQCLFTAHGRGRDDHR